MSAPIENLADWLNIATEKLSLPAKERIQLEIQSHFAEAVEAHRGEGLDESQAQARALTDLGDAKVAAGRFRKSHLTEDDVERIEAQWKSYKQWAGSLWMLGSQYGFWFLFMIFEYHLLKKRDFSLVSLGIFSVVVTFLLTIIFFVVNRYDSRRGLLVIIVLDGLMWLSLSAFFATCGRPGTLYYLIIFSPRLIKNLRLWLKIRKIEDFWQELPPPGTAPN